MPKETQSKRCPDLIDTVVQEWSRFSRLREAGPTHRLKLHVIESQAGASFIVPHSKGFWDGATALKDVECNPEARMSAFGLVPVMRLPGGYWSTLRFWRQEAL